MEQPTKSTGVICEGASANLIEPTLFTPEGATTLIISPRWEDVATCDGGRYQYLMHYMDWVLDDVKVYGDVLNDADAVRNLAEAEIIEDDHALIIHGSHGLPDTITGQDMSDLFKVGLNDEYLGNRTTYTLSCLSGSKLGDAVKSHGGNYIGYNDVLYMQFGCSEARYWVEEDYKNIWLSGALALIDGDTVRDACAVVRDAYAQTIEKWDRLGYNTDFLIWNMTELVCKETLDDVVDAGDVLVMGFVVDGLTGDLVTGASVIVEGVETFTDDFGAFEFDPMAPDTYFIVVRASGYRAYTDYIDMTNAGNYDLQIELVTSEPTDISSDIVRGVAVAVGAGAILEMIR